MSFTLTKKNSFSFDKLIWKVFLDEYNGKIVLELRNKELLKTSFASIDLLSNKLLWYSEIMEYNWWWNLAGVEQGIFVLNKYTNNSKNPESKGVWLGNIQNGKCVLKNEEWTFENLSLPLLEVIDNKNQTKPINLLPFLSKEIKNTEKKQLPFHYYEENDYFGILKSLIINVKAQKALRLIEYLEYKDFLLLSFFTKNKTEENMQQSLLVLECKTAKVVLEKIINNNLQGITLDSFFVWSNYLIFIEKQQQINIYKFVEKN